MPPRLLRAGWAFCDLACPRRRMLAGMLPRITADLPPVLGTEAPGRKVEELLVHPPGGSGQFWWVKVEKQGLGTAQAAAALAKSVSCDPEVIRHGGGRDRVATSVQWFTLPAEAVEHPGPLRRAGAHNRMRVLTLTPGDRPMDAALVTGLQWTARIKGGNAEDGYRRARAKCDRLRLKGLPNYVDASRQGRDGELARFTLLALAEKPVPPAGRRAIEEDRGRCLRAAQDALFNAWVAARVSEDLLDRCVLGDLLRGRDGRVAACTDPGQGDKRLAAWEASVLGPLFGQEMHSTEGVAGEREAAILAAAGVTADQVAVLRGGRRPARVQPTQIRVDPHGEHLELTCVLPAETYLDVLLDELMAGERPAQAGINLDD